MPHLNVKCPDCKAIGLQGEPLAWQPTFAVNCLCGLRYVIVFGNDWTYEIFPDRGVSNGQIRRRPPQDKKVPAPPRPPAPLFVGGGRARGVLERAGAV